ncbi:MAG: ribonuclease, partial [Bacteroidaceae bacterium]|nr:ribonuclease [Bacteroidaceae bacterium]
MTIKNNHFTCICSIRIRLIGIVLLFSCIAANAQIPDGYYDSLRGKKGAQLKNAIHELIKKANVLDYGSGVGHTWDGFYQTDRLPDNQCLDRYSNDVRYFTSTTSAPSGMNIEHSFP